MHYNVSFHLKIFVQGMIHVPEATARELMNLAATDNDDQVDLAQKRNDQQKSDLISAKRSIFVQKLVMM